MQTCNHILTHYNVDLFMRIFSAIALGFILGIEREITNKYAGLRTHILVCLGACVFTILSIYGFPAMIYEDIPNYRPTGIRDTARVAAQVVTGIGFIGAGTVLRNGPTVFGLTTAATLFVAASIGMACGAGMYGIAVSASVLSVAILTLIRIFERKVLNKSVKNIRRLKIHLHCENDFIDSIKDYLTATFKNINSLKMTKSVDNPNITKISLVVELVNKRPIQHIYSKLEGLEGINSISVETLNDK
ncbi:TPA: hypothetical protein CPT80_01320 [Candidatus Gastranaerophilales bacterium HUM_9]|nr:MAG TPA: hypothetical protein CPT80_01320 [Candidatus Gastranaerophilales bacterium HUM_9]HBX34601.1 hypothetical protein [Cyanobacteria bacterium UBA11440]